jgi:hypothetical protein
MAQGNVVVVRFTEPSKAYQALSVLKEADAAGRIGLESAAVVERTPEGAGLFDPDAAGISGRRRELPATSCGIPCCRD